MIKNTTEDTSIQQLEDQSQNSQNQQLDEQLCQISEENVLNQPITQLEQNSGQQVEEFEEFQYFEQLDSHDYNMISCPFCEEQMLTEYYQTHINLCQQQIGNYNLIEQECPQCQELIIKLYLNDHLEICPYNFLIAVNCPYCSLPIIKAGLKDHIPKCNIFLEQQLRETQGIKNCSICLDDIIENKTALECSHNFHNDCIKNWLQLKKRCPVCKELTNKVMISN